MLTRTNLLSNEFASSLSSTLENDIVSRFVQSLHEIHIPSQDSMTLCKVFLYGLKPCDLSSSTNDKISDTLVEQSHSMQLTATETKDSPETDYLNLEIKPLLTPTSSRSSTSSNNGHESSPIRVTIRETPRGRHHICVSQTLLRTHTGDMQ